MPRDTQSNLCDAHQVIDRGIVTPETARQRNPGPQGCFRFDRARKGKRSTALRQIAFSLAFHFGGLVEPRESSSRKLKEQMFLLARSFHKPRGGNSLMA